MPNRSRLNSRDNDSMPVNTIRIMAGRKQIKIPPLKKKKVRKKTDNIVGVSKYERKRPVSYK